MRLHNGVPRRIALLLAGIASTVLLAYCSTDSNLSDSTPVDGTNGETSVLTFSIGGHMHSAAGRRFRNGLVSYVTAGMDKTSYETSIAAVRTLTGIGNEIASIVFFAPDAALYSRSFHLEESRGFGVYTWSSGRLYFQFFVRDHHTDTYAELRELGCEVSSVNVTALGMIARRIIPRMEKLPLTYVRLARIDAGNAYVSALRPGNDLALIKTFLYISGLRRLDTKPMDGTMDIDPHGKTSCGDQCPDNTDVSCNTYINPVEPGYYCTHVTDGFDDCGSSAYKPVVEASGQIGGDTVNIAHNETLLYAYRDESLRQTFWGTKMYGYYYYLSDKVAAYGPSLSLKVTTTRVLYRYITTITKVMNESSHGADTLLPYTQRQEILNLLTAYKGLSANTVYNDVLDDIYADAVYYGPMTVTQFLTSVRGATTYLP